MKNATAELKAIFACERCVDRFHLRGHCQACQETYSADTRKGWEKINMSACEQFFGWMSQLKSSFRRMGPVRFQFLLHHIVRVRNEERMQTRQRVPYDKMTQRE